MPTSPLIAALLDAAVYPHAVSHIRLVETHISWVILTGDYAYKIKKPVDLGFLDFSTLDQRRYYCEEELRLNRRLAPDYYLAVTPITGSVQQPVLGGSGPALEFAVQMKQFSPDDQLDVLLGQGRLQAAHLDAVARLVAGFHQQIDVAGPDTDYGTPTSICHAVQENFTQIRQYLGEQTPAALLDPLGDWVEAACKRLRPLFSQRKADGFVRECHGDMHLRNLAWVDGQPLVFDCIEFNAQLRWIDTISEVAFLVMDLQDRGQPQLAWRFLNAWLEDCGDYAGIAVLRFYLVYRALVRAKVEAIRASQAGIAAGEQAEVLEDCQVYLQLASSYTDTQRPLLIITRGVSASGKSTLTQPLLEALGAIRMRSDVERKRLFGVDPASSQQAAVGAGIYTSAAGEQTYARLAELAGHVLRAGYPAIVDAACLQPGQVARFRALAETLDTGFVILEFSASADVLRQRIVQRTGDVSDAGLAVLEHQLSHWQALPDTDQAHCLSIDSETDFDVAQVMADIAAIAAG